MSPTRATVSPCRLPRRWRMVRMSSSPCVGCSWAPSPALITEHLRFWESKCGLPGVWCRTMITSTPMASMFLAVSMKVSPLERLLLEAVKSSVSAPSRRAARAKLVRVRVEFSKNKLQQVLPARAAILRPPWSSMRRKTAALSRIRVISSAERSSRPSKCRRVQHAGTLPNSSKTAASVIMTICPRRKGFRSLGE